MLRHFYRVNVHAEVCFTAFELVKIAVISFCVLEEGLAQSGGLVVLEFEFFKLLLGAAIFGEILTVSGVW